MGKVVRAGIGVVVLVVLIATVNGWYRDYKQASRTKSTKSAEASASVDSTQVVPIVGSKKVVVLVGGLVLRAAPAPNGAPVRALKKGEQLILVGTTAGSWLQLRDSSSGKIGYIADSTANLRVQK